MKPEVIYISDEEDFTLAHEELQESEPQSEETSIQGTPYDVGYHRARSQERMASEDEGFSRNYLANSMEQPSRLEQVTPEPQETEWISVVRSMTEASSTEMEDCFDPMNGNDDNMNLVRRSLAMDFWEEQEVQELRRNLERQARILKKAQEERDRFAHDLIDLFHSLAATQNRQPTQETQDRILRRMLKGGFNNRWAVQRFISAHNADRVALKNASLTRRQKKRRLRLQGRKQGQIY
ncbi:hypothetical protein BJV82DRAFT_664057 [Fennellomyces sp. T-0311]|nr:hypothetical protein BJV82DRAFT_664057 [Fennellomyces sp. T-0311]